MEPLAGGAAPGGGQALQPTAANFSANMAAKNGAQGPGVQGLNPQPTSVAAPRVYGSGEFAKPEFEVGQGEAQRQQNPGEQDPQNGLGELPDAQDGVDPAVAEAEAFEKYKAAAASPELPEDFMDKLVPVPWGPNGETRDVPVAEMRQGYMRQSDYTRSKQEIQAYAQRVQGAEQNVRNLLTDFQDPEKFYSHMLEMGLSKQMEAVAQKVYGEWFYERQILQSLPEGPRREDTKRLFQERRDAKDAARANARRAQQLEAQQSQSVNQQQQSENAQRVQNQINQLRPIAFKSLQIPDAPYHRHVFEQQLVGVVKSSGQPFSGTLTREQIMAAAQATREVLEDDAKLARAQANPGQQQPMGPNRLPAGAPAPGSPQRYQNGGRKRTTDFASDMAKRNGGRYQGL